MTEEPKETAQQKTPGPARRGGRGLALLAGLAPLLIFWLLESRDLTLAIVAAMAFGVGELIWSWLRHKKIDKITIFTTAAVLVTGVLSLYFRSGLLFKLKPAIVELAFVVVFVGSVVVKRPLMLSMAEKQLGRRLPATRRGALSGMTLRFGLSFLIHAALTVYAALYLSTGAWAFIKGVGSLIVLGLYLLLEVAWIRWYWRPRWLQVEAERREKRTQEAAA